MSLIVPAFATHYFVTGRQPFLNLSDLGAHELEAVLDQLNEERDAGRSHRVFGSKYMELRRRTEAKMRRLFVDRGGHVERDSPHYFVLGESAWFAALSPSMQSVRVDLVDLPSQSTSVTYPDSFVSMRCGIDFGLPDFEQPYHEQVFSLDELPGLVADYGLPDDEADGDYQGYEFRKLEKFIEIQVWTDDGIVGLSPSVA